MWGWDLVWTSFEGCRAHHWFWHRKYRLGVNVFLPFTDLCFSCLGGCQAKARRSVRSHPQAPIYEEMAGVKPLSRKLADRHPEEIDSSVYRNSPVKKSCPENHYESPRGTFSSQDESPKWNTRPNLPTRLPKTHWTPTTIDALSRFLCRFEQLRLSPSL